MAEDKNKSFDLSIDESVQPQEESLGTRLQPGIHENVILIGVEYAVPEEGKAEKWDEGADFTYETTGVSFLKDAQGNTKRDAAGQPIVISRAGEQAVKREFFDTKVKTKRDNLLKRIKHVMTKFITADEAVITAKSFQALIVEVNKKLEGKIDGVKLRLKIVKNSNGYGEVPGYTPFLERMDTKPSNLKISDKEIKGTAAASAADLTVGEDSEIKLPSM